MYKQTNSSFDLRLPRFWDVASNNAYLDTELNVVMRPIINSVTGTVRMMDTDGIRHDCKVRPDDIIDEPARIKRARIRTGLSQQQVAEALGLSSFAVVGFWEQGRNMPRKENRKALKKLIGWEPKINKRASV